MPSDVFQSDAHAAPSSLPALALAPAGRRPLRSLLALLAAGVVLWTLYAGRSPPPNDSTGDPAADSGVSKDVVPNGPLTESAVWAAEALSRLRLKAGSLVQETGARWSASFGPSTGGASAGSLVAEAPRWAELGLEETDNGLVVLPELAAGEVLRRHPVELLIEAATKKAEKQAAERPLTLAQAVAQYRELFATEPPLGFDQWFAAFDPPPSILPKAHDQFVSFLSIPGRMLRERTKRLDGIIQTFSIEFKGGKIVAVEGKEADSGRGRDILDLLTPVASVVPDLKVYFNVDDVPRQIAHHRVLNATTHYGSKNQLWPEKERAAFEDTQGGTNGYFWPCGPDSPVSRENRDIILTPDLADGQGQKTFIWDHAKAMDYCLDPTILEEHSLFLYGHPQPDVLIPMFSYCRSAHNMDLFGVPMDAVRADVDHVPWDEKVVPKVYWRGQATGMFANKQENWRASQRHRLYRFAHPTDRSAKVSLLVPSADGQGWVVEQRKAAVLAKRWLDIELVGGAMQCDQEDGTCDEMEAEIQFADRSPPEEANKFQFVVDVDGNGWSSRFRRLLLGGSVVLKSTVYPEWYSEELIPYYHYVPLQVSYHADLFDLLSFFTARPELARQIGENGRRFALDNWSWQAMQAYYLLSLLEYARATADDRDALSLKTR